MAETMMTRVEVRPRPIGDIVFVHGLGGDAKSTWMASSKTETSFWPKWVADEFPRHNVWSLQYDASPINWLSHAMSLPDRAINIADLLVQVGIGRRPVMFVVHSLGGLVIKEVLRLAHGEAADPEVSKIATNTHGIAFLATPHRGSGLASKARWLAYLGLRPAHTIEDLMFQKPELRELNNWFRNKFFSQKATHSLDVLVYREARPTRSVWIVRPESADPEFSNITCIPVDRNHSTICKPKDKADQVYVGVCNFIKKTLPADRADGHHISAPRSILVLDRIEQWRQILERCNDDPNHVAFIVHGTRRQNVGLFAQRIETFLRDECARKHGVPHRLDRHGDGSTAVTAGDWVGRMIAATDAKKGPLESELRRETKHHAAAFLYFDRAGPLRDLGPDALKGLETFLTADLPRALAAAGGNNPIRLFFLVEDNLQLARALHAALSRPTATIQVHKVLELTFPPWDEVEKFIHAEFGAVPEEVRARCEGCYYTADAAGHDLRTLADGLRDVLFAWEDEHR